MVLELVLGKKTILDLEKFIFSSDTVLKESNIVVMVSMFLEFASANTVISSTYMRCEMGFFFRYSKVTKSYSRPQTEYLYISILSK